MDSIDWLMLPYGSRGLLLQLWRKVANDGRVELGSHGLRGIAVLAGSPSDWPAIEKDLGPLLSSGLVAFDESSGILSVKWSSHGHFPRSEFRRDLGEIFIYIIQAGPNGPVKIGSSNDPQLRISNLQIACASALEVIQVFPGSRKLEKRIHKRFKSLRIRGEWFAPEVIADLKREEWMKTENGR